MRRTLADAPIQTNSNMSGSESNQRRVSAAAHRQTPLARCCPVPGLSRRCLPLRLRLCKRSVRAARVALEGNGEAETRWSPSRPIAGRPRRALRLASCPSSDSARRRIESARRAPPGSLPPSQNITDRGATFAGSVLRALGRAFPRRHNDTHKTPIEMVERLRASARQTRSGRP